MEATDKNAEAKQRKGIFGKDVDLAVTEQQIERAARAQETVVNRMNVESTSVPSAIYGTVRELYDDKKQFSFTLIAYIVMLC